jgi:preprotein translocase subunit SecY
MPEATMQAVKMFSVSLGTPRVFGIWHRFPMIGLLVSAVAFMIPATQGDRKIPVQYISLTVGRKIPASQSSYLPLKINYSGLMLVIFAGAILLFLPQLFVYVGASQWFIKYYIVCQFYVSAILCIDDISSRTNKQMLEKWRIYSWG